MKEPSPRRLVAILHADVVGYSRLMGTDEEGTVDRLSDYRVLMAECIDRAGGHIVDTAGDSLLAEFSSVVSATACAVEMQAALQTRNADLPPHQRLVFRMGIEMADVIARNDALYGDGINVAARIQALAEPGGVCVSDAVRRAVANRLPLAFAPLGEHAVKNITEPIKVFRVTPHEGTPIAEGQDSGPNKRMRLTWLVGVIGVAAVAGLLWALAHKPIEPSASTVKDKPAAPAATVAESSTVPSIAVLPFTNLSGEQEQEYFSDGISEDIIIDLSRVSNLHVIARNSSFYYKGRAVKTEDVGRELGVQYVLAGSVRKSGDRIRITVQLVRSKDAYQLWANRYDRKLAEIFSLQDEITQRIVSSLVVQLSAHEKTDLALRSTTNIAAYDLFLRGQQLARRGNKEGFDLAQARYRQAIQLDPRFGRAYGALAMTMTRAMAWGMDERVQQQLDQALELARQAVSLDSSSPQTHWVLGYVHLHRKEGEAALAAAQRSIEVAPNYADGYALLALIDSHAGRGDETIRLITRAMALNPLYTWEYPSILGRGYYNKGDFRKASASFLDALARNEFVGIPRLFLISCYVQLDRLGDARWEALQAQTHNPQFALSNIEQQALFWDKKALEKFLADLEAAGLPR